MKFAILVLFFFSNVAFASSEQPKKLSLHTGFGEFTSIKIQNIDLEKGDFGHCERNYPSSGFGKCEFFPSTSANMVKVNRHEYDIKSMLLRCSINHSSKAEKCHSIHSIELTSKPYLDSLSLEFLNKQVGMASFNGKQSSFIITETYK